MKHAIARLLVPLLRLLITRARQHRHRQERYAVPHTHPYSCGYPGGPTVCRTGERPPRGEDSPLVRPYLIAHERQVAKEAARTAAEERRQRSRRRHGVEVAA